MVKIQELWDSRKYFWAGDNLGVLLFFTFKKENRGPLCVDSGLQIKSSWCATDTYALSALPFVMVVCPRGVHNLICASVLWLEVLYNMCICNSCITGVSVWLRNSRGQGAHEIKLFVWCSERARVERNTSARLDLSEDSAASALCNALLHFEK